MKISDEKLDLLCRFYEEVNSGGEVSTSSALRELQSLRAEVTKLRADVAELESDLSASAESEQYLADRVDTLTRCILVEIAALEHNQRGSTHWDGCESRHHDCAAIKRMRAAIDQAMRSAT